MKYIFSGIGGCGTSFLVSQLRTRYNVHSKPDTFFVHKNEPFTKKKSKKYDFHQLIDKIDELPNKNSIRGFKSRTDFDMKSNCTIENNLLKYIEYVKKNTKTTVLFNSIAKFGFFSKFNISDLVVLVRHPLHAYASFVKPERHKNIADMLGGPFSEDSLRYYFNAWESNVSEYLKLKELGSILIRYEFSKQDANGFDEFNWIFNKWLSEKRNSAPRDIGLSSLIKSMAPPSFYSVYDSWDI